MLLLLLLLCGDVEVNPGPTTSKERQANKELDAGLIQDTSKEQQKREDTYKQLSSIESSGKQSMQSYCISIESPLPIEIEQQYTMDIDKHRQAKKRLPINETEKREQQLSKNRTLSRARFTAEKSEQRQQRLLRSRVNQARRLKEEDETARQARLEILKFSARQKLKNEDDKARQMRLEVLKFNASHRLNKENETARQARLQVLKCNTSQRLKNEDKTARQARLQVLKCNASQRLKNEGKTARQARLQVLKCNASQRVKKEDETARQARLEAIRRNYREKVDKEDEASRDKRLQTKAMNVRRYRAKQSLAQKENYREKARMRMQTIRGKQATLAAMQEPSRRKDEKLQLTDDNEESTKTDGVKIPDPSISVNSMDTKQLIKADITEKKRKHSVHHNKLPEQTERSSEKWPVKALLVYEHRVINCAIKCTENSQKMAMSLLILLSWNL